MTNPLADFDAEPTKAGSVSMIPLFLSLFLLVLAFFILLISISSFEDIKSKAVMDSLTSTFAMVLPPTGEPTEFSARDGDIVAGRQFQAQIETLFSTSIQLAKIEIVQPGKYMRASFPIETLFEKESASLRPVAIPLLDRVVAALSGNPPGLRFELDIIFGVPIEVAQPMSASPSLDLARAGSVGRAMSSRGVPPGSLAVGLEPGDPSQVVMWFSVRRENSPVAGASGG